MGRFRYAVIANDEAETSDQTSGVFVKDLPERGILNMLDVQMAYKKSTSDDRPLPDFLAITKIEVLVNGSQVVKSLTGRQVKALMWYNGGPFATKNWFWGAGGGTDSYSGFSLYFGRSAKDTKAGLDLSKYANPQLRITYALNVTSFDGNTYDANSTDPAITFNVMAKILDGPPVGFLNKYVQSKELTSYTVAASTEKLVEIPRGQELFGILFGSRYKNVGWNSLIDKIKLDFDNGSWLPITMDHENIIAAFKEWFPDPVLVGHWSVGASSDDYDTCLMGIIAMASTGTGANVAAQSYDAHEMGLHDPVKYNFSGGAATGQEIGWQFQMGWGPHQTIYIPMRELVDGDKDSIDTNDFGRIDFAVTTGAGAGSSAISHVLAEYLIPND